MKERRGKLIAVCGKICSGKSRYVRQLTASHQAVLLSCDELMTSLFPRFLGEKHDQISLACREYLHRRAVDICLAGCDVVLDWGFWQAADRTAVTQRYQELGIPLEWHYVEIDDASWEKCIRRRNENVAAGLSRDYPVDEGLLEKLNALFQPPQREEMDVWINNQWMEE